MKRKALVLILATLFTVIVNPLDALASDRATTKRTTVIEKVQTKTTIIEENHPEKQAHKALHTTTRGLNKLVQIANRIQSLSYANVPFEYAQYCKKYALVAVKQAQHRLDNHCGDVISPLKGDLPRRWNQDPSPQYNWCLTVNSLKTRAEALYRERRLNDCSETKKP